MVEMLPVGCTIIRDVKAAVGGDDDMPAILGIDPEVVLVGVESGIDALRAKRLAAVVAPPEVDAKRVDDLFIGWIDADDGEVERSFIEAVDAGPGFAGVGGFVDAAGVGAVGALLILHVGGLTGEAAAVGPAGRARRARFEDQVYVLLFGAALIGQLHLVAGFLAGERL